MPWLLALIGAFLGALVGSAGSALAGFVGGALLGWQQARIGELRRRLDSLELRRIPTPQRTTPLTPEQAQAIRDTGAPPAQSKPPVEAPVREAAFVPQTVAPPQEAQVRKPVAPQESASATSATQTPITAPQPRPTPVQRPVQPAQQPRQPDAIERAINAVWNWFTGGNVPVKIGLLVLLFGIGAALKYAAGQGWVRFPMEFKLATVAALGVAALIWGWRNREARPAFGLSLQGGGIGILLLTVFTAYRLVHVLEATPAFALVLVLVTGAALLAVLQNAPWLAFIGFLGGYLAPVLLSTGSGSHVALFSWYALLNLAVFAIAWKKHWRALNLTGFFFTFGVGLAWGAKYYKPEFFGTVEPFLVLFFAFYFAIPLLHALRGEPQGRKNLVDGTLVFGTPLLAFPMQAALLSDQRMMLALSALVLAYLYGGFAWWLLRRRGIVLLGQSYGLLALGFATLAVPLAFSAQTTSAVWALEGAAAVWLGLRQQRWWPQVAGIALQFLAAFAYAMHLLDGGWDKTAGEWPVLNGHALSVLLLALASFCISRLYERANAHRVLVWLPFLAGDAWWTLGGVRELLEHFDDGAWSAVVLYFGAVTLALSALLRSVLRWPRLGWNVIAGLAMGFLLAAPIQESGKALEAPYALAWLAWFAVGVFALWRLREPVQRGISAAHIALLATVALLYGLALNDAASTHAFVDASAGGVGVPGRDWIFFALFLPLIVLVIFTTKLPKLGTFPLADLFPRYSLRWHVPAAFALGLGWLASLTLSGDVAPLPFVPLLNPAELAQIAGLLIAVTWLRHQRNAGSWPVIVGAGGAFVVLSLAALRAVHHFANVPWSPSILDNGTAQTALTVLWSVAGVAAWIAGSRRMNRALWTVGAIGLGLVLLKLMLIDRQYMGNVAGIVSFLAVGGLLVLVGRIAPTPPRTGHQGLEE